MILPYLLNVFICNGIGHKTLIVRYCYQPGLLVRLPDSFIYYAILVGDDDLGFVVPDIPEAFYKTTYDYRARLHR